MAVKENIARGFVEIIIAYGSEGLYCPQMRQSEALEKYIELAPKWDDGPLYRGVILTEDELLELQDQALNPNSKKRITMQGISSWTSDISVAKNFSIVKEQDSTEFIPGTKNESAIFVLDKTNNGTSIAHVSENHDEMEVIVSKKARFKLTKFNPGTEQYIFYLKEIEE